MPLFLTNQTYGSSANLVSPALTGTPTAPTAPPGTGTTQLATTAFVLANANLSDLLSPLLATPVAITGGLTLTAANFGRMHVCSGTSANYTVTLPPPAGNAGKLIGFLMAPGLTKLVTITRNASDLIDGATTRVMWANESATLYCDGNNWAKVAGKSVPMSCVMYHSTATTIPQSVGTYLNLDGTTSDPTGAMADPSSAFRINIVRPAIYAFFSTTTWNISASVFSIISAYIIKTGSVIVQSGMYSVTGNFVQAIAASSPCVVGDYVQMHAFQQSNASQSQSVSGGSTLTFIQACEQLAW